MKNRSLISIDDLTRDEYIRILDTAEEFEKNPNQDILRGKIIATLFFEPSTRTRLSFESAVNRLGGRLIGFSDPSGSSVQKGESLKDTILTVNNYCDLIVIRHPREGSARFASESASVPVINAGDGANQHPTQCLLDLYSIRKTQGTLDHLNIAFVGDLKHGRTVHSLSIALTHFNCTYHLVSPPELKLPSSVKMHIKAKGLPYFQYTDMKEALLKADIIYMTRIQRERFSDPMDYEKVKDSYNLNKAMLAGCKPNVKVLHPLPRVKEIDTDVDDTQQAYYFTQALNGIYVRQAILKLILA